MGQQSSIKRLPREVRELIGSLREQGRTIDEILAHLKSLDVVETPSRSALGRHVKSLAEVSEKIRRSREVANALVAKLGDAPESKTARLNIELMHSVILDVVMAADGDGGGEAQISLDPMQAMLLAKALDHLGKAEKANVDVVQKAREQAVKQAATAADKVARKAGISDATRREIEENILGLTR